MGHLAHSECTQPSWLGGCLCYHFHMCLRRARTGGGHTLLVHASYRHCLIRAFLYSLACYFRCPQGFILPGCPWAQGAWPVLSALWGPLCRVAPGRRELGLYPVPSGISIKVFRVLPLGAGTPSPASCSRPRTATTATSWWTRPGTWCTSTSGSSWRSPQAGHPLVASGSQSWRLQASQGFSVAPVTYFWRPSGCYSVAPQLQCYPQTLK